MSIYDIKTVRQNLKEFSKIQKELKLRFYVERIQNWEISFNLHT